MSVLFAGGECPALERLNGGGVNRGFERGDDLDVAGCAIRLDHAFHPDDSSDAGLYGLGRVLRLHFLENLRRRNAVARLVDLGIALSPRR